MAFATERKMDERSIVIGLRRRRVLVVDDCRDIADMTSEALSEAGHVVTVAYDGASAIRLAVETVPEVVLLDIGMPGMDGFEVARRLRAIEALRGVVLVALTGYGTEQDRERGRTAGCNMYLVKPLAPETICEVVRDAAAWEGESVALTVPSL